LYGSSVLGVYVVVTATETAIISCVRRILNFVLRIAAEQWVQIPGKPPLCVCEYENILNIEFDKFGGGGAQKCSYVFNLNLKQHRNV
jgi:hypothetical protein